MRTAAAVVVVAGLVAGCQQGPAVNIRVALDASANRARTAEVRSLEFTISGSEQAHVARPLSGAMHEEERIIYSPRVANGQLFVTVVARAADGDPVFVGSGTVALTGGIVAADISLMDVALVADVAVYDFGNALVDTKSQPRSITIHNVASRTSGPIGLSMTGDSAAEFSVLQDNCTDQTLDGDASCSVVVAFAPSSAGAAAAVLTAAATPGGGASISLTGVGVEPGALSVTPAQRDFGTVGVGHPSSDVSFVVMNTGSTASGVVAVSLSGASFGIGTDDCTGKTLEAGKRCTVDVHFAPTSLGPNVGTLTASSTPGGSALAMLTGTGVAPAAIAFAPTPFDYGTVDATTTSAAQSFVLTNGGTTPTSAVAASIVGDTAQFTVASNDCMNAKLAPGGSCTIVVKFAPKSFGNYTMTVNASATDGGATSATLTGIGRSYTTLTVQLDGSGSGNVAATGLSCVGATCTGKYARTSAIPPTVSLSGTPAAGSSLNWSGGGCAGSISPCSVLLDTDKSVTATFNLGQYALAVVGKYIAGATGTITSNVGGINCGAACNATYAYNSPVTLTATPTTGYLFQNWTGDCSGTTPTCMLKVTAAMNVTATFRPKKNYAFTTSTTYVPGTLGGLAPADAACQARANAGGLGGKYVAFLSTSTVNARDRIASARGWLRPDGRPMGDTTDSIFVSRTTYYPLILDEFGKPLSERAYTVTGSDLAQGSSLCSDWTDTAGQATLGFVYYGPGMAFTGTGGPCSDPYHLYCFQTDYSSPTTITATAGMTVFITKASYDPSSGVGAADALCHSEAAAAGLESSTKYKALLATVGASASSRFSGVQLLSPVVRPDGTIVSATEQDFFAGNTTLSYPGQCADKSDGEGIAFTGSQFDLTDPGTAAQTCQNWSTASNTASGYVGSTGELGSHSRAGYFQQCNISYGRLLCLLDP